MKTRHTLLMSLFVLAMCPLSAGAQVLVDAEVTPERGNHRLLTGVGLEASPRLAIGYGYQTELGTQRPWALSAQLAWQSPVFLLGSSDHHGAVGSVRVSPWRGPLRLDVSAAAGWQTFGNEVATGQSAWGQLSLLPTWHGRRVFVGARLGARSTFATRIAPGEDYLTQYPDAQAGWYSNTALYADAMLRAGGCIGKRVCIEGEGGMRRPIDAQIYDPYFIPWVVGLRVNTVLGRVDP